MIAYYDFITCEYVLMCSKATQLKKQCPDKLGDLLVQGNSLFIRVCYCPIEKESVYLTRLEFDYEEGPDDRVLVYTQHQLQYLLGLNNYIIRLFNPGYGSLKLTEKNTGFSYWGNSFEELWLRFVMREKYNKVWEESDWR